MIVVEYLVFVDNSNINCSTIDSFNHFLQSNPEILISDDNINYEGSSFKYHIQKGEIIESDRVFFHVKLSLDKVSGIGKFGLFLKEFKRMVHVLSQNPQILFDGISLHYSQKAYPVIYEIENLMRKLITKFMLINVGVGWMKDRVPDDVKKSVNTSNKEVTYLHNVDFIQLQNFLFSEKFTVHKDNLIRKMKQADNINDLDLEEIKQLIPMSNWDKYFEEKVNTSREKLSKLWTELYNLRCKIAHNKTFHKGDLDSVIKISNEIKPILSQAIESLGEIDVSNQSKIDLEYNIAGSFNKSYTKFITHFRVLNQIVIDASKKIYEAEQKTYSKVTESGKKRIIQRRKRAGNFLDDVKTLLRAEILDQNDYFQILEINNIRNSIGHFRDDLKSDDILGFVFEMDRIGEKIVTRA